MRLVLCYCNTWRHHMVKYCPVCGRETIRARTAEIELGLVVVQDERGIPDCVWPPAGYPCKVGNCSHTVDCRCSRCAKPLVFCTCLESKLERCLPPPEGCVAVADER